MPKMPNRLPETLGGGVIAVRHTPSRQSWSSLRKLRMQAITRPIAWSATHSSLAPRPLVTTIPRARAASTSTVSWPTPMHDTSSSAGIAAISAAVSPMVPMVSTA
ncbi:hypothetical protein G6F58_013719 [Rhizopus delemar]|nr:hypothetical protein G6F68_020218 [Rhizopus microsporus]KAG1387045.1 hypothetical protein G6F58_013719 [Rhizopus delemar]